MGHSTGLSASGFYDEDDGLRHFALTPAQYADLRRHVDEARELLGENRVQLVEELGSVKMTLYMFELLDALIAEKLGFHQEDPVFGARRTQQCHVNALFPPADSRSRSFIFL